MSAERSTARTCPKCGQEVHAKNKVFCPNCGVNMVEYAGTDGANPDVSSGMDTVRMSFTLCPYCEHLIDVGAPVCKHCGRELVWDEDQYPVADAQLRSFTQCPYCAEEIKAEAIVCKHCGRDLEPNAAQRESDRPTAPNLAQTLCSAEPIRTGAVREESAVPDSYSQDHFERGLEFKQTERWAEAIGQLEQVVEIDPTHAEAHFELGEAYSAIEDHDRAQGAYQDAIAACPGLVKAYLRLVELYEDRGATHRVVETLHRAIEADPDSVRSHYYTDLFMELALGSGDSYHRIVAAYQRAVASQPNCAGIHYNLGRVLSRRFEASAQEQAIVEYQQAISLRPNYPEAFVAMGNAYLELGQPREALLTFQRASTMEWAEGKLRSEFTGSLNRTDAYLGLAKAYIGLGQYDQVIPTLQLAIDMSPDDGSSIFEAVAEACDGHGAALLKQDDPQGAKRAFQMLVGLYGAVPRDVALEMYSSDWSSAYFSLAASDYRLALQGLDCGDRDRAVSLLDEALEAWESGYALPADRTEQGHQLWKVLRSRIESARKRASRGWRFW